MCFAKHCLSRKNTFQKYFEMVLPQITFVFCHTPNNCFHICKYPTVMQKIVSTTRKMTSAAPSVTVGAMLAPPSKLPWLPRCCRHCRRRHCRCHYYGCHHLRHHQHCFCCHCYRFLVDCCLPLHCLCFSHRCLPSCLSLLDVGCQRNCHCCRSRKPLPPAPSATTT